MNENFKATLKSAETEDWLDLHVIRPFCYYLAVFFNKFDIHPNTVTIWSMIVGAASAIFFGCGSLYYSGWWGLSMNIIAIVLLMIADILDCTDGQLARLSGKKSRLGRILDGVAGFAWFIPIYHLLVYRFYLHHDIEFSLLGIEDTQQNVIIATVIAYILGVISGVMGLAGQQRLADYYIQVHLFFLKGEKDYYIQVHLFFLKGEKGAELDNSKRQQEIYDQMTPETHSWAERYFQKSYIDYTKKQEKVTPQFQRLMQKLREKFGASENIPESVRKEFHDQSLPVIFWNGLLTFPVMNFVWEIVGMGLLYLYINRRHEAFCKKIADTI